MALSVSCPSCRKTLSLGAEDAGRRVMCRACGASFLAPPLDGFVEPPAPSASDEPGPLPPLMLPGLGLPEAQPEPPPSPSPRAAPTLRPYRAPRPRVSQWLLPAAIALGLFLLLAGVGYLANRARPPRSGAAGTLSAPVARGVVPSSQPAAVREQPEPVRIEQPAPPPPSREPAPPPEVRPVAPAPRIVTRPPPRRIPVPSGLVSDEQIGQAIRRSVDVILAQFANGQLRHNIDDHRYAGMNALCVYALLQAGQATNDPRLDVRGATMKQMLARMKEISTAGRCETYTRGIRATALAAYNRPEDRAVLREDVKWLIDASIDGGHSYTNSRHERNPDNSNSQYGLLGVWSGAEVGVEVPTAYWSAVQRYWERAQLENGQWGYMPMLRRGGTLSMTAAGLTSLFVTHDYLEAPQFGKEVGRPPFSRSLAAGIAWLETGDNAMFISPHRYPGYTLYGLERVGLASGFKYFGTHDWYPELAASLLGRNPDGPVLDHLLSGFARIDVDDLVDTAFGVLFLARGRHPILMNKLRFDGHWANRPRDLANLARFASRELERPVNWQVIPIDRDWPDWMDCPILYIASHQPPRLTDLHITRLRQFIEAGGMIYSQADGDSPAFDSFIAALGQKLCPDYEWSNVPANHPLFTLNYRIDPPPPLRCISNGSRILMLHSPTDLAQYWQLRAEKTKRSIFEFGVNLFIYAAGKADLRNRLNTPHLPPLRREADYELGLARVRYPGNWDPEPHAIVRFGRWLEYETGYHLDSAPVVPERLRPGLWPVAHLAGTARHTFSEGHVAAIRRYVEDGGILLIDSVGGGVEFDQSAVALLQRAFPAARLAPLPDEHPILRGGAAGMEALKVPRLRPGSNRFTPRLQTLAVGKGHVFYSSLDLSTGLLGINTVGIHGYEPAYARALVKNLLIWSADRVEGRMRE